MSYLNWKFTEYVLRVCVCVCVCVYSVALDSLPPHGL